jgi:DNA-binding beta-propeller fold protein YncE
MNYAMLTLRPRPYVTAAVPPPEGWNLSAATFSQSFSVSAQDSLPIGLAFSDDGNRMYVVGNTGDDVNEYSLGTAWDIGTATYTQSFSVAAQETNPAGLAFSGDGTRMYVTGFSNRVILEYALSTAWDVSTATYTQNFSVSGLFANTRGLAFSVDGTRMYVASDNDDVNEYSLGTAWDISTASLAQSFSTSAQESNSSGVAFRPTGRTMFVIGLNSDSVHEYALSAAWDISTASHVRSFSVASQDATALDLAFRPDGLAMFITGADNDAVYEYSLTS